MKHASTLFMLLAGLAFCVTVILIPRRRVSDQGTEPGENPRARAEQEWMMLRDPATGLIPPGIFAREREFARRLPSRRDLVLGKTGSTRNAAALTWIERGPTNVGGRTRAFGIDARTSSAPNITMIAGGVSGGLWRSTNDGTSWTQVTSPGQLHNVSCLVQDPRTGKEDTWYAGSGESFGNSASMGGASFRGDGIFTSTDNGLSWAQLPSTSTNTPQSFDQPFDYVINVAMDLSNAGQDELYAAASNTIQRSTDGGTSWTQVLGSLTSSTWSDVQVTSGGVVYAALPSGSANAGIWRSPDGVTWTSISAGVAGFPTSYGRIVIALAPSDPTIVYFLIEGSNGTDGVNQVNSHQIWRYGYVSGTGAGAGGTWANRGVNLPSLAFPNEPFNSQSGYDLLCKTSPTDPNFVLVGGTNLYRSTDGFASTGNTARIGGYDPNVTNGIYPNHHPDQHAGAFRPGSSIVFYSGHDGGLARTSDITTNLGGNNPVSWTSLNNGYNVTQFYGVSIAPESGSDFMLGGTQDNGNRVGSAPGASSWVISPEGGDGTFTAVAPLADNRYYSSTQLGSLRSRQRSTALVQSFTPSGSTNQLFVNPFLLDPGNSSLLYYAAGNSVSTSGVWRNSAAASLTPSTAWTYLTSTSITGSTVSALGVSTANPANILYYGSSSGQMRRVVSANVGATPTVSDITAGLPTGYINCIAVDPADANIVLVVFTNYNVQSLWYSTNGGTNWTDVEGNLAGASGPSLRWAKIFSVAGVPHYFVAASTGVYFSTVLNGALTVWTQEATGSAGNVVCTMLDWRANDGTLALATHGRGIFTTTIATALPIQLTSFTATLASAGRGVRLEWSTASEINNYGFFVERRGDGSTAFAELPGVFLAGQGTTAEAHAYNYTDFPASGGVWHYRLRQVDVAGGAHYSDEVTAGVVSGVRGGELPRTTTLLQNYPNPFNPATMLRYQVSAPVRVRIVIYDVAGREVATLIDARQEPGEYVLPWNARGYASGIYFARLTAGSVVEAKKLVLAR